MGWPPNLAGRAERPSPLTVSNVGVNYAAIRNFEIIPVITPERGISPYFICNPLNNPISKKSSLLSKSAFNRSVARSFWFIFTCFSIAFGPPPLIANFTESAYFLASREKCSWLAANSGPFLSTVFSIGLKAAVNLEYTTEFVDKFCLCRGQAGWSPRSPSDSMRLPLSVIHRIASFKTYNR